MAAYNRREQTRRTLDTIFRQEYPDLDVVLVDDGSTDDVASLRHRYPIRYIRVERAGWCNMSHTFNVGIRAAKHDILIMQSAEVRHLTRVFGPPPPPPPKPTYMQVMDDLVSLGRKPIPKPPVEREYIWVPEGRSRTIADLAHKVEQDKRLWVLANVRGQTAKDSTTYTDYCSTEFTRPCAFFLSCLRRRWLMEIRGFDEDYVKAGHDDNDLATRLIEYVGLHQEFTDDIRGEHQWHEPSPYKAENREMFEKKCAAMQAGTLSHVRNKRGEWGIV